MSDEKQELEPVPAEGPPSEVEQEWTRDEQRQRNARKLQVLMQMGVDVNSIILTTRLEHLIELLLPQVEDGEESPARVAFDDGFEVKLEQACDGAAEQVRADLTRKKLSVAGPGELPADVKSLVIPK